MKTIFLRTTILPFFIIFLILTAPYINAQGLSTIQLTNFKAESRNGNVGLSWKTQSEKDIMQFEIEYSQDGKYYRNMGFIPARNNINGDLYEFEYSVSGSDSAFYRLKVVDKNGKWLYTDPVLFKINNISPFFINPSVINTDVMNIFLQDPFYSLEVVSLDGIVLLKQNLSGKTGRIDIPISPTLGRGAYIVRLSNYEKIITQKIIIQ